MVFLRGLVWGLIGLIYAPLLLGVLAIFQDLGLTHAAFVPAAALAAAASTILYEGRQIAIAGTAIGVTVASLALLLVPDSTGLWGAVCIAVLAGGALGWWADCPDRCSLQVPGKALAGLATGALCGGLLALVEPLHPFAFRAAGTLAFLVSANGVLYVATVPWWVKRIALRDDRICGLVEAGVVALLAGLSAGGLWVGAATLTGLGTPPLADAAVGLMRDLPLATFGGVLGGAVAGMLLEVFGFPWVYGAVPAGRSPSAASGTHTQNPPT